MSEPHPLRVSDALDKLVHQFSDPLSFYRELIQNSLDAGSEEVEINLSYETGDDGGVGVVRVDDWGSGMTREIIEKQLTRLFSSSKDGDRTKIGKFGIGFVSVFAIDPHIVCVDTSREGESCRVLFGRDKRYELRRLDAPVDGTKIHLYKPMSRRDFDQIVRRSREVVRYWCKHVRGEVRFQGEVINEPIDVDAAFKVRDEDDHNLLVVGHAADEAGAFGFYNRGLTLLEGKPERHAGLVYKISSDHLEHTLTRDNVIQDENYQRVLTRLDALVEGPLCREVFARLDAVVRAGDPIPAHLHRAAAWHLRARKGALPRDVERAAVARSPSGQPIPLAELRKVVDAGARGKDAPLQASARSPLTDALEAQGRLIVLAAPADPIHDLVAALGPPLPAAATYCTALPPRGEVEARRWQPLAQAAEALLAAHGAKLAGVAIGHLDYPESAIAARVAITQRRFGDVDRVDEVRELGTSLFARRRLLVLNADHPTVASLVALAHREPEFAAYVLCKLFFLGERLDAALDGELAALALGQRDRRLGA